MPHNPTIQQDQLSFSPCYKKDWQPLSVPQIPEWNYEAWAEQRRTGYPRLIKVAVNNSGNTISTDDMIRRVFFNQDYKTDNKALYDALVSKLGGADNGGTRLWWDTGRNNF